jgi:hypothetical protein
MFLQGEQIAGKNHLQHELFLWCDMYGIIIANTSKIYNGFMCE